METKKKILIVAGLATLGLGVYFLTKKNADGTSIIGGKRKYIDEGDSNKVITLSPLAKANALYNAMNRAGTEEDLIFETLTGVTQLEFGKINKAFGFRNYNGVAGKDTYFGTKQPLKKWLKEEMSSEEYNLLRKKFPNYL